jgi:type IV pilus assembly protein PilY1
VSVNGDPLYQELDDYTRMYQATYRSDSWVGDVSAYQIDAATGDVAGIPDWTAADRLETVSWDSGRIIATYNGSNGIPFRYDRGVLSTAQQLALGSDLVNDSAAEQNAAGILNYVRGERSNELQNSGSFRDRFQVLGDIVHSSPVYHNGMLYAGGNDGMLHAFDAASGDERFAYVPELVFGNLAALADPDYSHKYFVDLSPTIRDVTLGGQDKSILVGGLGKGGKGYYALDITDPADITDEDELAARVRWEFPDPQSEGQGYLAYDSRIEPIAVGDVIYTQGNAAMGTIVAIPLADAAEGTGILDITFAAGKGMFQDGEELYVGADVKVAEVDGRLYEPYMGYSYSRPVIAKSNDPAAEWLVIFGNGYNSSKSHAVLYILNLNTGQLIRRIDTGAGNCNGLSSPIAIDIDSNGTADYVYAGDLQGNLWKFDLYDTDAANWGVAYQDPGGNPAPVFQAKNYSGHPQPITSKPDVMYHCSQPGYLVVFGTGRYLTELDLESSESASIYGIWDYGDDDDTSEYLGSFERTATPQLFNPHLDLVPSRTRVELLEQTVEPGTWTTADGQTLRVITDNSPVWGTVADGDTGQTDPQPDPGSTTAGDTVHAGWYFDLPNAGEMAVSDVIIRDGKVLVISFTPGKDPCGSGGNSIFHAMDTCTGARSDSSVFADINEVVHEPVSGGQTTIAKTSSNWKEPTGIEFEGRLQPPVILRKGNMEYHYLSSSTGEVHKQEAAGAILGVFYWLQID